VGTETETRRESRRRFFVAGGIGAFLAVLVFVAVLLDGHATIFAQGKPASDLSGELSRFYDVQAHSLLEGRWTVPPRVLGVEAFRMDHGTFIYFGPWPAVLRMPVAAVTHSFDGRLTQVSMLLAFAVALVFTLRLAWRVRTLALGATPVGRFEAAAVGGFLFVAGAGSALVFLGADLVVFQEAIIWGVAWALGAFELLVGYAMTQKTRPLVLASGCTVLALASRAALGVGPLLAMGLLLLVVLLGRGRRAFGMFDLTATRWHAIPLALGVLVPTALYVALNMYKFDTPFGLPFDRQAAAIFSAIHRAVLKRNDGSMVGLQFLPTNALQYFRPDAIAFQGAFPWVKFPHPATIVGDVRFDQVMATSSVPISMPLFSVLGIAGLVGVFWRTATPGRSFAALRAPVVGAAGASLVTLTFGFLANRYVGDFLPFVTLLALAGLYLLLPWTVTRTRTTAVRLVWAGVAVLAVVSVWFATGLAVVWRDGWTTPVLHGTALPAPGELGTVFIQGDCDGSFRSSGSEWRALELTPKTGFFRLGVTFPKHRRTGREPLVVSGRGKDRQSVFVAYYPHHKLAFGVTLARTRVTVRGRARDIDRNRAHLVDVRIDPLVPHISVRVDGVERLEFVPSSMDVIQPVQDATVGRNALGGRIAPRFSGTITALPIDTPDCRRYQRQLTTARP
jgi:hypothetical protein